MSFGGKTYDPERDADRLRRQLSRTWAVMYDKQPRTLKMIAHAASALRGDKGEDSEAAISARLRDFRKAKFGSHTLISQNRGGGIWWYQLIPNIPKRKASTRTKKLMAEIRAELTEKD